MSQLDLKSCRPFPDVTEVLKLTAEVALKTRTMALQLETFVLLSLSRQGVRVRQVFRAGVLRCNQRGYMQIPVHRRPRFLGGTHGDERKSPASMLQSA